MIPRADRLRLKWVRELERARERLAATQREDYARERDFKRVMTLREHAVRRLEKKLRGEL